MAKIITQIPSISNLGIPEAPLDGNQYGREDATWTIINESEETPDATTILKGKIKLAGDLAGTADNPTTPTAIHVTGNETKDGVLTLNDGLVIAGGQPTVTETLNLTTTEPGGLQGKIDPILLPISTATINAINTATSGLQEISEKGQINGYSGLDLSGKNINSKIPSGGGNTGQIANINLTEKTTFTDEFFVNFSTGNLQANSAYTSTGFIDIKPNTKYRYNQKIGGHTEIYGAWYDKNGIFISGINVLTSVRSVTSPANAYKVRLTYKGIGSSSYLNFYFYETYKMTSYGDSITAQNSWQPTVVTSLSLSSSVKGFSGYRVSGTTGLNQDAQLLTIDSDSDLILLLGGTNDWANNVPLGTSLSTSINDFYGAMNVTISKLKTNYPNSKIVVLATTYGEFDGRTGFTDGGRLNAIGLSTTDYANVAIAVAKNHNVRYINTQNVWDKDNISYFVTNDGAYLHPNSLGGVELGTKIALDLVQDVLYLRSRKTDNTITLNTLLKSDGTSNYIDSQISDNGTEIGIGVDPETSVKLKLGGSVSGSSNLAKGFRINPTLTATSNNTELLGLEINPVYNGGGFSSITNTALKVISGESLFTSTRTDATVQIKVGTTGGSGSIGFARGTTGDITTRVGYATATTGTDFEISNSGGGGSVNIKASNEIYFANQTKRFVKQSNATGNWVFQDGGTFTDDAVNRLQVSGTIKASPAVNSDQVVVKSQLDLKADNLLTGFTPTTGTITGTDTVLQGIQKNAGNIGLKANLASPIFTGAPEAPIPIITNGIANKGYVDGLDSNNLKLTGNQTFIGVKSSINTGTSQINGISLTNNGTGASSSLKINNESSGIGVFSSNSTNGIGILSENSASGAGIYSNNYSTGTGITSANSGNGTGIIANNSGGGMGISVSNSTTGIGIRSNGTSTSTGFVYVGQNNGNNTFTVTKEGLISLGIYTVDTLPTPTGTAYATVTDAMTPTYLGTLIGGGSVVCPVFYNGTSWVAN